MIDIYNEIEKIRNSGKKAALCIIVDTQGSTPRKAGAKMIVFEDKKVIGSVGGGNLEKEVIDKAYEAIEQNYPVKFTYELMKDLSMHCGGKAEVYIEPLIPMNKIVLFGAGHVGKAVAEFASRLGFHVTVYDERKETIDQLNIEGVTAIHDQYESALQDLIFDERTYIVVVTPQHAHDEKITAFCAKKPYAYLGMIGSKKKVAMAKERFREEFGLTQEEIDKINMPIGIPFAAQLPEEIAISIIAKIIDVKNKLLTIG